MLNLERLKMEIRNIVYPDTELTVYLEENGLHADDEYNSQSATNKRAIHLTALSILESLANDPALMKKYKLDDITVSDFAENLQNRIDQLERKIRMMAVSDNETSQTNTFMLFNS
ncbi:hypothetical protein [Paenibacillus thermotolerans]|uniref:hypothetical protein n=1 Tax=Paenibacillus thermotolerans TaxID=3027807 RepID=UPI0023681869|nr:MULTISPECIES: hypothetical protein [unclassified Paenibacillus]